MLIIPAIDLKNGQCVWRSHLRDLNCAFASKPNDEAAFRGEMECSNVFLEAAFVRKMDNVHREMWRLWCGKPEGLGIEVRLHQEDK